MKYIIFIDENLKLQNYFIKTLIFDLKKIFIVFFSLIKKIICHEDKLFYAEDKLFTQGFFA